MSWLAFALSTAFFESIKDVFSKKNLQNFDEYVVSWFIAVCTALILSVSLLILPSPILGEKFWITLLTGSVLNSVATLIYVKAIKNSDLSITAPVTSFTPLFLLLTSPVLVGEKQNFTGLIGIFTIIFGSYFMNFSERFKGKFFPFKKLFLESGPRLVLIVAFIWSITSNLDKIGIRNSSPIFWAISMYASISILMLPLVIPKLIKLMISRQLNFENAKGLVWMGFFNSATVLCQMIALKLAFVAYVISIKRLSAIFSVLFGYFFFKEKKMGERALGAFIMILGTFIIALSHTHF